MTTCSTHVLDAASGRPASGVAVELRGPTGVLGSAATDADGRVRFDAEVGVGDHTFVFATGPWFAGQDRAALYPEVTLTFTVDAAESHYHLALLLSPYSYTTYRGS
jgi:5-hydroxyisourate hydrolase